MAATKQQREAVRTRRLNLWFRVLEAWHDGIATGLLVGEYGADKADIRWLKREQLIDEAPEEYDPTTRRTREARIYPSMAWKRTKERFR